MRTVVVKCSIQQCRQSANSWIEYNVFSPSKISVPKPQIRTLRTWMFFAPSNSRYGGKIQNWVNQRLLTISKSISGWKTPARTSSILQSPKSGLKGHGFSLGLQNQDRAEIQNMGLPKTSDHIKISIRMQNPSQDPPVSSKAPNQNFKDMDVV